MFLLRRVAGGPFWIGLAVSLAACPGMAQSQPGWLDPLSQPAGWAVAALFLLAVVVLAALLRALGRGDAVSVESHWGGFAGGLGGWRFSRPLALALVLAVIVATMGVVALVEIQARSSGLDGAGVERAQPTGEAGSPAGSGNPSNPSQ